MLLRGETDGRIHFWRIDHPKLSLQVALVTRRGNVLTPVAAQLGAHAREEIGRYGPVTCLR